MVKAKIDLFLVIALVGLVLGTWAGVSMYSRTQMELLWGYRTLGLFIGFWLFLAFAIAFFRAQSPHARKWMIWSSCSGLALGIGFPGYLAFPLLLFGALMPLLWLERDIVKIKGKASGGVFFPYLYHSFFLWNIISTFWVANSSLGAGIFTFLANTLLMTIPWVLFHYAKFNMPKTRYLSLIVFWICYENLHYHWDLAWPWLTLGNSFAQWPQLVQWYEYTGVFGGSLWVLLLNILLLKMVDEVKAGGKIVQNRMLRWWAVVFFIPVMVSLGIYFTYQPQGKPLEVAVVQPNYEPHYVKFNVPEEVQLTRFLELSKLVVTDRTKYLVCPEASFGPAETHQFSEYPAIIGFRRFLQDHPGLNLVMGMDSYTILRSGDPHSKATREYRFSNGEIRFLESLNAAVQITENPMQEIPVYKKSKLVPGPEIFPFRSILFFMEPVVKKFQGTVEGVATQPERSAFSSQWGRVGPAICYESVFGQYFTGYIQQGAQAIFIMTNDGWWDNTPGHLQHLYIASLRSIETRRDIARSANTGVSAFINQRGDIQQATRYDEATAIRSEILFSDAKTFYVKWGDLIARISLLVAMMLAASLVVKVIKKDA